MEHFALAAGTEASDEASTSRNPAPRPTHPPRSHRRKDGQPPRPPNAWICYRAERSQELRSQPEYARIAQSEISKIVARFWRDEDPAVRRKYELEAQELKRAHREKYPDYTYSRKTREAPKASASTRTGRSTASTSTGSEQEATAPSASGLPLEASPAAYPHPLPPAPPSQQQHAPFTPSAAPAPSYLPRMNALPYPASYHQPSDPAPHRPEMYTSSSEEYAEEFAMRTPSASRRYMAAPPAQGQPPPHGHAPPPSGMYAPPLPHHQPYPHDPGMASQYEQQGAVPVYHQIPPQPYPVNPYDYDPTAARRPVQPAPEQLWRHGADNGPQAALPWSYLFE
ncbi:hypothetical protein JCM10908_001687 [Rhodotorula pacifica]|uniref:HMG-box domain-containing protein n=1 Tax=Rhodotorula pacifica TaxID=1495444 RepID=UPI003170866F